jgi:hypothetical protein
VDDGADGALVELEAGLLAQLAHGGLRGGLALVEAAAGRVPPAALGRRGRVVAVLQQDAAVVVDQQHARRAALEGACHDGSA